MTYKIREVCARDTYIAEHIRAFNQMVDWPPLSDTHLLEGHWWFIYGEPGTPSIAFAGMVPMVPFPGVGYLKRAYVDIDHRGHGLQRRLLEVREAHAKKLGWTLLVSECAAGNQWSARNFAAAGFEQFEPEQRWGEPGSMHWKKALV